MAARSGTDRTNMMVLVSDNGGFRSLLRGVTHPELVRTCKSCGYQWKVPRYYARMRPSGQGGGSRYNSGGLDSNRATVDANAAMADEVATFRSCAKCGSQDYSQKRIWHESKADYDGSDE
jgi:predicted nucleic-acid-binding Zn-ribbon protein